MSEIVLDTITSSEVRSLLGAVSGSKGYDEATLDRLAAKELARRRGAKWRLTERGRSMLVDLMRDAKLDPRPCAEFVLVAHPDRPTGYRLVWGASRRKA